MKCGFDRTFLLLSFLRYFVSQSTISFRFANYRKPRHEYCVQANLYIYGYLFLLWRISAVFLQTIFIQTVLTIVCRYQAAVFFQYIVGFRFRNWESTRDHKPLWRLRTCLFSIFMFSPVLPSIRRGSTKTRTALCCICVAAPEMPLARQIVQDYKVEACSRTVYSFEIIFLNLNRRQNSF